MFGGKQRQECPGLTTVVTKLSPVQFCKITRSISNFQLAYVEDLNGPWLFESMYAEDPEASKLSALPGMQELLAGYPLINVFTSNSGKNFQSRLILG